MILYVVGWQVTAESGQLMTQEDNHTNKRLNTERSNPQSLKEGHKKVGANGHGCLPGRKQQWNNMGPKQSHHLGILPPGVSGVDDELRSSVCEKHLRFSFKSPLIMSVPKPKISSSNPWLLFWGSSPESTFLYLAALPDFAWLSLWLSKLQLFYTLFPPPGRLLLTASPS